VNDISLSFDIDESQEQGSQSPDGQQVEDYFAP
jgi:hypothetical protein